MFYSHLSTHQRVVRPLRDQNLILLLYSEVRVLERRVDDLLVQIQYLVVAYRPRVAEVEYSLQ